MTKARDPSDSRLARWRKTLAPFIKQDAGDGQFNGLCPVHEADGQPHKTPSASFNLESGVWRCASRQCERATGSQVERLVASLKAPKRPPSVAPRQGTPLEVKRLALALRRNPERLTYLKDARHISKEAARDANLGWSETRQAFTYPVFNADGEYVGSKYKDSSKPKGRQWLWTSDPRPKDDDQTKPSRGRNLWPSYDFGSAGTIIIVEGEDDCLALTSWLKNEWPGRASDFRVVTSAGGAATWDPDWGALFTDRKVYIGYDSDEAGRFGARSKVVPSILPHANSISVLELFPDRAESAEGEPKDWVDWIGDDGSEEGFKAILADAERIDPFDFSHDPDYRKDKREAVRRKQVNADADQILAAGAFTKPESTADLAAELAIVEELPAYVVEGWHMEGHNVTLVAEFKTGKTTLLAHLMKCLCDDEPFLGRHDAHLDGHVAYWNSEMTGQHFRAWLHEMGFEHLDRAALLHLRGHRVPLTTPVGEDFAVEWLRSRNVDYWIVDTFARAMADCGLNENDNSDVERFTSTLDVIKERAGVRNLILSAHTGRAPQEYGSEHARGATRLDDWADARWILTRQGSDRFLRADGRDVEQPELKLLFDHRDRSFGFEEGDRRAARQDEAVRKVVEAVVNAPGIKANDLVAAVGMKRDNATAAIREAERRGEIRVEVSKRAHLHYPVDTTRVHRAGTP